MSNGRKHGMFAANMETVRRSTKVDDKDKEGMQIVDALEIVFQQMQVAGNRERTIESYRYIFKQFVEYNELKYVEDITIDTIYNYLSSLQVTQQTKLIRLKSIKAVLSKFYNNGWFKKKFWSSVHIKIDKQVKKGTNEDDVDTLLSLIDQTTFVGFRDSVAILTMYSTGIRIRTLGELKENHIDFNNLTLNLDGSTLKNHQFLKLPISQDLAKMFKDLIHLNDNIRPYYGRENKNIFITQNGLPMNTSKSSNCAISKQLNKYSKRFGIENINAHAIRRGYAKNLLNKGANIALISKALGHSDLAITTKYLHLDIDEVVSSLRNYC
ncbi:tyrosine-type recombinase/integrase [Planococcus salinarum]|uniref:tyrosine-type recombinase/integrase n=1 Tax=Planococcus salinarum TaxID=622695 RepID=UPI000E3DBE4A|nr:site-specific integrase [Planococcus salinarum]TAA71936.1 site-specific integrase [Planococcus salinarum]